MEAITIAFICLCVGSMLAVCLAGAGDTPADREVRRLANLRNEIERWPVIAGFVCRRCGSSARSNPSDIREWGCAACGGSTHSLVFNFVPVEQYDYANWGFQLK